MRLQITDPQYLEEEVFGAWLLAKVKLLLAQKLDEERIALLTVQYKNMPVLQIMQDGILNLIVSQSDTRLVIELSPTATFRKTGYKLAQLCRAINYGCLDIKGYPIFTDVFSSVTTNVQSYYTQFEEEVMSYVF